MLLQVKTENALQDNLLQLLPLRRRNLLETHTLEISTDGHARNVLTTIIT